MAAQIPVVSTTIGAEGLSVNPPHDIRLADTPAHFAAQCLELLTTPELRARLSQAAAAMVTSHFSWEQAARAFEQVMLSAPRLTP